MIRNAFNTDMEVDDEKYLKTLSPGPTTPSQIHLQQLAPILIGGETLDPIKEEMSEGMMALDPSEKGHSIASRHDREMRGTFWPEKPRIETPGTAGGVKASTVLTNLQRGIGAIDYTNCFFFKTNMH